LEGLKQSGAGDLERIKQYLLPNETVRFVCKTQRGYLVLSDRRVVFLKDEGKSGYIIDRVMPYDCVLGVESRKSDSFEVSGRVLNKFGEPTNTTKSIEVRAPKGDKGESKADVLGHFESTMNQFFDVVEEIRSSGVPDLDLSYLKKMPESLTRDAVLDLNTILRDQPVPDELVHEAVKLLGDEPFLLEESLRSGNDNENGVLFAAGTQGYYWIRGKKEGRFMSDVIVDTVEWENVRCFTHLWHLKHPLIYATYSLTRGGKETTIEYQWSPPLNDSTRPFSWILQPLNGPWILADVKSRCTGISPSKSSRSD
jgi:hypothetical protein